MRRQAKAARKRYGQVDIDAASVVVALGGDGLMLQSLHRGMACGVPVYGMNFGTIGFLMNDFAEDHLLDRLSAAKPTQIYPLSMEVIDATGITSNTPPSRSTKSRCSAPPPIRR